MTARDPLRGFDGKRVLIHYPVPMEDFTEGPRVPYLFLPKDLTRDEAERVKALIDTLVIAR